MATFGLFFPARSMLNYSGFRVMENGIIFYKISDYDSYFLR